MRSPTAIYFDSALIAKFYLNEPGADRVRELAVGAGNVVSSAIAVAEVSAAFHRKLREQVIERDSFRALQGQFQHDLAQGLWTLVPVSEDILQGVQALFARLDAKVFLRSVDALHLVTAQTENFDRIYSNDRHLLAASPKLRLKGVDPIT